MAQVNLIEGIRQEAIKNVEKRFLFGEELISNSTDSSLKPFPAQLMRVYEVIENRTKRILFADSTGFGKTYVSAMILGLLNKKKRKRHKTLVIAPSQSIRTAWKESEINDYFASLNLQDGRTISTCEMKKDNLNEIINSDLICVNYHKFNCATSEKYVQSILDLSEKIDLLIFDEGQNNRSFGKRGTNIKKLIDKTRDKRVLILSATPGHNGLEDLGIPLHILDPERFHFTKYDYNSYPTAIKDMILSGKWFNSNREVVRDLFGLPELKVENPTNCDIGLNYARKYLDVWKNGDLGIGSKIALLRKFSLLGKIKSNEGKKDLEELLESFPKDSAVVTFTHLKTGVSEELFSFLERFYGKGNVAMINGDTKMKDRIEISTQFSEGKYKALANSLLTMSEGIPCITRERPARLILFEMPQNHGQEYQVVGRVYRPGQKGDVSVHHVIAKNEWLSSEMRRIVESKELEEKYGVIFPKNWRDSTIDLDIYDIMRKKEETNRTRVENGLSLDEVEQIVMNYNENSLESVKAAEKVGVFRSLPKKEQKKESPMSLFTRKCPVLYGIGEKELYRASKNEGKYKTLSKLMLNAHTNSQILDTAAGDTVRIFKQIIEALENKGVIFNEILDEGCGTGVVSKTLDRELINLDLDERMLKNWHGWGGKICGFMTQLPFRKESFDLATFSYSLFYNKQKDNEREIEKALMETNRVLKDNGYALFSLVRTTKEEDIRKITKAMNNYGFNVLISDFFRGYNEGKRSNFTGAYVILARKEKEKAELAKDGFIAYKYTGYRVPRAHKRLTFVNDYILGSDKKIKNFKKADSREFRNKWGVSLSEIIRGIRT